MSEESNTSISSIQTPQPPQEHNVNAGKKLLLLSVFVAILIPVFIFVASYFDLVPKQTVPMPLQDSQTKTPPQPTTQLLTMPCPSIQAFCNIQNIIRKDGEVVGIGERLPKDTEVYAVFEGQIESRSVTVRQNGDIENYRKVTLTSLEGDFIAEYFFKKGRVSSTSVKKGDVIFTVSQEGVLFYDNSNLVFRLSHKDARIIPFEQISFQSL